MSQNPQMDILYMQALGHVVGIFTRTAEPPQIETDASAFVGDGLQISVSNNSVTIPPGLVAIFRSARAWRQIFQPANLYVSGLPTAPALKSFPGTTLTVTFTTPNLKIAPIPVVTGNILVLAQPATGGTPVTFNSSITAAQASVNLPMTGLAAGQTYNAFVFIPGYPITPYPGFIAP